MKTKLFSITALFLLIMLSACQKDIIVKDIKNETVNTLSPPDGFSTPNNSITFWWDKIDGADKYTLQIVSPSFSNIQQLITDTSTTSDKLTKVLQPGTYQWRIRATNGGGNTAWTTRTLTIDTTSNLSFVSVLLLSPSDSLYSNVSTHTLNWYAVNNATSYYYQVQGTSYNNASSTTTTSFSQTFPAEGTYIWKVRAENSFSVSQYSTRTIIIDQTAPTGVPTLSYPANNALNVPADTVMRWNTTADSYKDIIYYSTDSSFATYTVDTVLYTAGTTRTYSLQNFAVSGNKYYWKVKSMDKAKNVGSFCNKFNFSVQ